MNRFCLLLFLLLTASLTGFSQPAKPIFPQPLSPRLANYQIDVTLDPATKKLTGRETLTWRNPSQDAIRELRFHLYLNAFKDEKTTFMSESGGQLRGEGIDRNANEKPYGSIDIVSIKRRGGDALAYQFIQPDDRSARTGKPYRSHRYPGAARQTHWTRRNHRVRHRLSGQTTQNIRPHGLQPGFLSGRTVVPKKLACMNPPVRAMPQRASGTATSFMPTPSFTPTMACMM